VTNLVERTTATAAELTSEELRRGAERLERKVRRRRPQIVAILGVDAYRRAFDRPKATIGLQSDRLASATVWILPNPSGLNAHYQLPALVQEFSKLRRAAPRLDRSRGGGQGAVS
jgi:TDG/mug DNA glycosylase family protein